MTKHHLTPGGFDCRHCNYFLPQGRRGGMCQRLSVLVSGNWPACSAGELALSPVREEEFYEVRLGAWEKNLPLGLHDDQTDEGLVPWLSLENQSLQHLPLPRVQAMDNPRTF